MPEAIHQRRLAWSIRWPEARNIAWDACRLIESISRQSPKGKASSRKVTNRFFTDLVGCAMSISDRRKWWRSTSRSERWQSKSTGPRSASDCDECRPGRIGRHRGSLSSSRRKERKTLLVHDAGHASQTPWYHCVAVHAEPPRECRNWNYVPIANHLHCKRECTYGGDNHRLRSNDRDRCWWHEFDTTNDADDRRERGPALTWTESEDRRESTDGRRRVDQSSVSHRYLIHRPVDAHNLSRGRSRPASPDGTEDSIRCDTNCDHEWVSDANWSRIGKHSLSSRDRSGWHSPNKTFRRRKIEKSTSSVESRGTYEGHVLTLCCLHG